MQAVKGDQNVKNDVTDDKFFFFLNEKKITLDSVDPTMTLNDFIRGQRTFKSLYFEFFTTNNRHCSGLKGNKEELRWRWMWRVHSQSSILWYDEENRRVSSNRHPPITFYVNVTLKLQYYVGQFLLETPR